MFWRFSRLQTRSYVFKTAFFFFLWFRFSGTNAQCARVRPEQLHLLLAGIPSQQRARYVNDLATAGLIVAHTMFPNSGYERPEQEQQRLPSPRLVVGELVQTTQDWAQDIEKQIFHFQVRLLNFICWCIGVLAERKAVWLPLCNSALSVRKGRWHHKYLSGLFYNQVNSLNWSQQPLLRRIKMASSGSIKTTFASYSRNKWWAFAKSTNPAFFFIESSYGVPIVHPPPPSATTL